ncbi:tat binding protein 1(TBP-1)-interacting protein [Schizosaccharomyces japonicus yFS275]|uniref:Tat binding protein 1(TBP-1)-interacting protein n=1 Tax=Schizosaccharomyces japonicus (strain yFS275 / FY16936) TaxID=402676 RepID=B6K872_SCHJY|nr:tat binding protein 1(TBP-1)-interacting protein [Schizosaccharomyces japonicus yFS275]EEB09726.1 tat binding protein 1(TBP-1)-interacting protein [Schizosaccharomyces japonicus yFS275]
MAKARESSKSKSLKGEAAEKMIFDYLRKTNRPYSATDISANLKNAVTKTVAQRTLEQLREAGMIHGKNYGKQIVYVCLQEEDASASPEELGKMDARIKELREQEDSLKTECKHLSEELHSITNVLTNNQLKSAIEKAKTQLDELNEQFVNESHGKEELESVTEDEQIAIAKNHEFVKKSYKARKKMFYNVWNLFADNLESPIELWTKLGFEKDELE